MKTIKYTPKSFLLASSMIALMSSSFNSSAQEGVIWTQTQNFNELGIYEQDNKLFSSNVEIQTLINTFSIDKISRAVPSSKKVSLQNLVEITCNCEETDLLVAVSKLSNVFTNPEIGPHYETLFVPDDYSLAFTDDYALNLINAKEAWDYTHGDSSIIIAISDQNFQMDHEELIGKVHYYDTTNTSSNVHGTAVASIAAGNTNNGIGKSSIGYDSELAFYRMSYDDLLIATYSGYRVINTSWTSGCIESMYIQNVIDEIYQNGSIVVAAAGNGTTCGGPMNLVYPAACKYVISVTGIGSNDNHEKIAGDSLSTFQHNSDVDISAPGILVPLTIGSGNYLVANGTSFSAPFVTGTIALMLSVDSCLTFEDIETILYSTSVNIDSLNPDYAGLIGHGRLNAGAAIAMASTYMSCTGGTNPNPNPPVDPEEVIQISKLIDVSTQNTAGINDEENIESDFRFFPNPVASGGTINIVSENKIQKCEISGVNGEIVQVVIPTSDSVRVDDLSQGTYFAKVLFESGVTKVKRIIVF